MASEVSKVYPVVVSQFMQNTKEIEFDAVAQNGEIVNLPSSEYIQYAGVHSGDATLGIRLVNSTDFFYSTADQENQPSDRQRAEHLRTVQYPVSGTQERSARLSNVTCVHPGSSPVRIKSIETQLHRNGKQHHAGRSLHQTGQISL